MSYCTVDEVCAAFPSASFQRNAEGSVSDAQIQKWIDEWASQIESALLGIGFDVDTIVLNARQQNFLRRVNRAGAVADLGSALGGTVSMQSPEYSTPAAARKTADLLIEQIIGHHHDVLFGVATATPATTSKFAGIGGAETTVDETPEDRDENRSFGKGQVF